MAGYHNYSMSNNAVAAYQDGEKPISKWAKSDILALCGDKAALLKPLTVKELRNLLLYKSSLHHTSSYYNVTDFYSFDHDALEDVTSNTVDAIIAQRAPKAPKQAAEIITAEVRYTHWVGTRKHPKPIECRETVTYKSTDKIVSTENGNKRLSSLTILRIINEQ